MKKYVQPEGAYGNVWYMDHNDVKAYLSEIVLSVLGAAVLVANLVMELAHPGIFALPLFAGAVGIHHWKHHRKVHLHRRNPWRCTKS